MATSSEVIAAEQNVGSALVLRNDQSDWTPDQALALFEMFNLGNAPVGTLGGFFHLCQVTHLDPFKRQIYLVERRGKYTPQTSIDGFRLIRDRSKVYDGDETLWCGPDGVWVDAWLDPENPPVAAKFSLYIKGRARPVVAVALWREYVQTKGDGSVTQMWDTKRAHMLAKVAEALAIRKAFPDDTGGLYTDDEMDQAANAYEPAGGRKASPGIMDLEEPPIVTANAEAPVGGLAGFMDMPDSAPESAPADGPGEEIAEVVPDEAPEQQQEPAPAAVPAEPVAEEPEPDSEPVDEGPAAVLDMAPEAPKMEDKPLSWSAALAELCEIPDLDEYKLRTFFEEADAAGATGQPVPWAGMSFYDTVMQIRANLAAGQPAWTEQGR